MKNNNSNDRHGPILPSHLPSWRAVLIFLAVLVLLGLFGLFAGCQSYTWGTKLPPAYRDAAVPLFANSTSQPEVEALLTQDVRRQVMADGALQLKDLDHAAIIIRGRVRRFDTRVARFSSEVRDLPVEFRANMSVEVWVEDTAGNILLPRRTLTQNTTVVPTHLVGAADGANVPITDMTTAKQAAAIRLSSLLARDILFYINTPNK